MLWASRQEHFTESDASDLPILRQHFSEKKAQIDIGGSSYQTVMASWSPIQLETFIFILITASLVLPRISIHIERGRIIITCTVTLHWMSQFVVLRSIPSSFRSTSFNFQFTFRLVILPHLVYLDSRI